jgi:hypothetical protein
VTWLQQLIRRWRERDVDLAWKATGIRQTYAGYDQGKAQLASARADALERQRRLLAQQRAGER